MLEVINVSKKYNQTTVLNKFNLKVEQGKSVAIIGSSGSGKSTLLNILGGVDSDYNGRVIINNKDISTLDEKKLTLFRANNLGFVYQFHHLLPDFTALENVCLPLFIQKYSKKEAIKIATEILVKVGLEDKLQNLPSQLSGGQRQRVMIARSLCTHPKILLLDEPTASIDVEGQRKIYELLKVLNKTITIVVVSHDISVILNYASKVAHINKTLTFHDIKDKEDFNTSDEHFCEVELLQMLNKEKNIPKKSCEC